MSVQTTENPLIPALVAQQAASTPTATAVVDGDRELSYAELDQRAGRLAHLLLEEGAGPETVVGVALDRGIDLVVALLAVWRTGAGFVTIDPTYPAARLQWLLNDTGAEVVLAEHHLTEAIESTGARVIVPSRLVTAIAVRPVSPVAQTDPDALAYVMYTSGSTGQPKGVAVTHAGIANRVRWAVDAQALTSSDRILQKTRITFDAMVWEFFGPLVSGGTVVLAPAGSESDPKALLEAVTRQRITVLQVVPSVLRLLVDESGWDATGSLRLVSCAGEPLHAELAQRLLKCTDVELWNTYGPTECSIDVTAFRFDPEQKTGPVPIGRPIKGMRVLVLDPVTGSPAAVGAVGELYAGGVGVARGYLNRPELTADRFVPDPYGKDGWRVYGTGDLVRWREDGNLEYVGRTDDQVKINGVRLEPGEIEAALAAHPNVAAAVVTAKAKADGSTQLVAYVTAVNTDGLRNHLLDRLPETHVPSVFVAVDEFPLTPNGKVDKQALPDPFSRSDREYIAPRTTAEQLVADVWRQLLGVEQISVHDSFFELGGTSLTLTRLANQLRSTAGGEIQLRGLLRATTVEAQAKLISAVMDDGTQLTAVPRTGTLPLSASQRRLWFMEQLETGSSEWVAPTFLRVPSDTPFTTVQKAVDALVARHETLRTRYQVVDAEPTQVIDAPAPVELRVIDIEADELAAVLTEEFSTGFDLVNGPVLRALLTRSSREHLLTFAIHHIATDGWSASVLARDFEALLEGRTLDPLEIQYADFAAWQQRTLTEEVIGQELDHWRGALDRVVPLDLPTDHPRPLTRDPHGAMVTFTIPAELATALDQLGRKHGCTPFSTLLTAYATVLARFSGTWDVTVGAPVAGRDLGQLEDLVGFFLNTVVLRCKLAADVSFDQALELVRASCEDAFAHSALPFDRLVDELAPDRDLSRTPLYQAAFDFHGEGFSGAEGNESDLATIEAALQVAKTDLTLNMRKLADGSLLGAMEYATALFDRGTIDRITNAFLQLLQAFAAAPATQLGAVDLLSADDRHQLIVGWNDTAVEVLALTTAQRFEAQALETPDAIAVSSDTGGKSYKCLDRNANRVAHHLAARGVKPGDVVAVLLDRGPLLLASMLGAWKAGAAYLPIDPSTPADRIAYLQEDAAVHATITQARYVDVAGSNVVLVDQDADLIAARSSEPLEIEADLDAAAYVIYTSGSTGKPKGVEVSHRGLVNHLDWAARELAGAGTGGAPVFSSVAFDLGVPNLWAPLLAGQTVHMMPADLDLGDLGKAMAEHAPYSFVKLTPSHLEILSAQLTAEQAQGLAEVLVVAGEPFTRRALEAWRALAPDVRVINEYGPTEASVGTSIYPVPADDKSDVLPIGLPLPNLAMYVLDADQRLVPVGVVGELYVGGTGVANGYINRPELTAERFVKSPYGRLYRTGDLVRRRSDGNVEFLGRTDHQVKIRGYRIEPEEIQIVLAGHADVTDALVIAREDKPGDLRLVAYYVGTAAEEDLAAHAARWLPDYLVPAAFVALDKLPLNANGKVDRAALPVPENTAVGELELPGSVVEERIAEIWAELLDRQVGIRENFFRSGGNSILAIRLIAKIQNAFEIDLPVRAVFEGPTVAELAAAVEDRIRAEIEALSDTEVLLSTVETVTVEEN